MKEVTVYTKNGCPQCDMTKMVLKEEGVEFKTINIEDDSDEAREGRSYLTEVLGFSSLPVVVVEGEEPFSGFRPDKLKEIN